MKLRPDGKLEIGGAAEDVGAAREAGQAIAGSGGTSVLRPLGHGGGNGSHAPDYSGVQYLTKGPQENDTWFS